MRADELKREIPSFVLLIIEEIKEANSKGYRSLSLGKDNNHQIEDAKLAYLKDLGYKVEITYSNYNGKPNGSIVNW